MVLLTSHPDDYPDNYQDDCSLSVSRCRQNADKKPCMISIHAGPYMAGTVYFIYFRCAYLDVLISVYQHGWPSLNRAIISFVRLQSSGCRTTSSGLAQNARLSSS